MDRRLDKAFLGFKGRKKVALVLDYLYPGLLAAETGISDIRLSIELKEVVAERTLALFG